MERDAHYFAVGVFVIATLVAGFFFAGLFVNKDNRERLPYIVHFSTPVEGLMAGNEVRFMGVSIGEVDAVSLLEKPAGNARVAVRINVLADAPVNTATVAVLRQQSLTGLMYLNLIQSAAIPSPAPLPTSAEQPAVIPTQLSDFDTFLTRLPDLEARLDSVLSAAEDLLNPANRQAFSNLLLQLEQSSRGLPDLLSSLQQTGEQLTITAQSADQLLKHADDQLDTSLSGLNQVLADIRKTTGSINTLATSLNRLVVSNETTVSELLNQSRDDLHQLLTTSRQVVNGIQGLLASLTRTSERLNITAAQIGTAVGKTEANMGSSMQELNQTLAAIRQTAWQLGKLVTDADRVIVNNEGAVNELLGQGGEDFKQLLQEFRATAREVRQLSEKLEREPSQIIYESTPQGIELPR
ncbi:MAG: MlaD family protein [Thiolinea sp.]